MARCYLMIMKGLQYVSVKLENKILGWYLVTLKCENVTVKKECLLPQFSRVKKLLKMVNIKKVLVSVLCIGEYSEGSTCTCAPLIYTFDSFSTLKPDGV